MADAKMVAAVAGLLLAVAVAVLRFLFVVVECCLFSFFLWW